MASPLRLISPATLVALLAVLVSILLSAGPGRAEIWKVDEYRAIQEAILTATYGDTVSVAPGTYEGPLVLRPGIYLLAEEGRTATTLRYNGAFYVLKADGTDSLTVVDGFFVDGGKGTEGVILANESQMTIRNCEIHGGWSGIRGLYSQMTIEDNVIRECQNGIYLFESEGVIRGNDIQLCITGISLVSASPRVIRNTISRNTLGFRIAEHSDPTIGGSLATANRVWNNQAGGLKNEAYLKRDGLRTMNPYTVRVAYNFWGSDCPDSILFQGPVEWSPWVDESGEHSIDTCKEEASH
jgi:parallel beta-helix repeat protein